jgi:segregation and condensation protein B
MKPDNPISDHIAEAVQQAIEAILFASSEPMAFPSLSTIIKETYDVPEKWIEIAFQKYREELQKSSRGIELAEIAGGFILRTKAHMKPLIDRMCLGKTKEKLSSAQLETLACIAFRQPITKQEIEAIRGVDSSASMSNLLERKLIETAGRKEVLGRPHMYQTTQHFLKHFGLKDLHQLRHAKDKIDG